MELPYGFEHETPQLEITVFGNHIGFPFTENQSNLGKTILLMSSTFASHKNMGEH